MGTAVKSKVECVRRRAVKFTMLLTKDERAALERIAEDEGLTSSDVLRMFIRARARTRAA